MKFRIRPVFILEQALIVLLKLIKSMNTERQGVAKFLFADLFGPFLVGCLGYQWLKLWKFAVLLHEDFVENFHLLIDFLSKFKLVFKEIKKLVLERFNSHHFRLELLEQSCQRFLCLQYLKGSFFNFYDFFASTGYFSFDCRQLREQLFFASPIFSFNQFPFLIDCLPILFLRAHHRLF